MFKEKNNKIIYIWDSSVLFRPNLIFLFTVKFMKFNYIYTFLLEHFDHSLKRPTKLICDV